MADKEIVQLPASSGVTDETLVPAYQPGASDLAQKVTVKQLREYVEASIPDTVNAALAQAKESGEFDGEPGPEGPPGANGHSPVVTIVNGVWYIDGESTSIGAVGPEGPAGPPGSDGQNGKDGNDATVTADSIKAALGYTPANEEEISAGGSPIVDVTRLPIASDTAMELPNLTQWAETENAGEYSCAANDNGEPIPEGNYKITDPDGKLHLFTIQNWGSNYDFGRHLVELLWNSVDGMSGMEIFEYYEYDNRTGTTKRRTMSNGLQFSEELNENAFYRLDGNLYYYDAETAKRLATEDDIGTTGGSISHSWNGTVLTVTSASGTSSADLKGDTGDTGPVGPAGRDGQDGYTPVKGVDYFDGKDGQDGVGIGRPGTGVGSEIFNYESNVANGQHVHAEGYETTASGHYTHAEGYGTTASAYAAHAEGSRAVASGYYSHAEGEWTEATGNAAHAEGTYTEAIGYGSHAEGSFTYAVGDYAHAEGCRTIAIRRSQHAQGEYNIEDIFGNGASERGKYVHIVGNGTSISDRSNAHTLDWAGNAWFAGDVYVGGTGQDDPEAKRLVTEDELRQLSEEIADLTKTVEPEEDDIPKVFISGEIPTTKDDVLAEMEYISTTDRFKAYLKIKCQGSSSMDYPKKNFTVKMYSDEAREVKLKKTFKNWGFESNKYVLKANYIDHTHARNIVSARLWNEAVSTRSNYDSLPNELKNSPKNGAIDGFPVKVYTNGTYQGVYTWNIGKDAEMFCMDENNPNHALLSCCYNDNDTFFDKAGNFRALWSGVNEDNWEVEIGSASDALTASLNRLIVCVKDTDDETFKATIGQYLDIPSALDYYLYFWMNAGIDSLENNMLLATYDGVKWYCSAYDMDSVWGLHFYGKTFLSPRFVCPTDYQGHYSLLWERISKLFANDLKTRYNELRNSVWSFANIVTHFERFTDVIGHWLYEEDLTIYPDIPSGSTNNIQRLRKYVRARLEYVDAEIAWLGKTAEPITVGLASGTALNSSGAAINFSGTYTSDFVKIEGGKQYRFTVPAGSTAFDIWTYTESKVARKRKTSSNYRASFSTFDIVFEEADVYIRICIYKSSAISETQIVKVRVDETVNANCQMVGCYRIYVNGNIYLSSGFCLTNFYPVDESATYTVNVGEGNNIGEQPTVYLYDEWFNFVDRIVATSGSTNTFTVPVGVKYARWDCMVTNPTHTVVSTITKT